MKESLDFRVEPKFVGTLKGQRDKIQRSGIMVPVLVGGNFSSPKFRPDLEGMIKQELGKGIPEFSELKKILKGHGKHNGETKTLKNKGTMFLFNAILYRDQGIFIGNFGKGKKPLMMVPFETKAGEFFAEICFED